MDHTDPDQHPLGCCYRPRHYLVHCTPYLTIRRNPIFFELRRFFYLFLFLLCSIYKSSKQIIEKNHFIKAIRPFLIIKPLLSRTG